MTAVEQIVYNLADNAAKYARFDGSILKLKLTREKRFLVIRVEDGERHFRIPAEEIIPSLFPVCGGSGRKTAWRGAGPGPVP